MKNKIIDWLNESETTWVKDVNYKNRSNVGNVLFFGSLISLVILFFLLPDYRQWIIAGCFVVCASLVIWLMFFHFKLIHITIMFVYRVAHEINNTMMTMYSYDYKLFYSLDDAEAYNESPSKKIDFIDLKKEEPITYNEKGEELIFGETEKEFMENMDEGMRQDIEDAVEGHPDSRFLYLHPLNFKENGTMVKPKITPELKKLMPDLKEEE